MCLNPINIINPTRRFVNGVSQYRLNVPCGCCKECEKTKQDDWFVRAFFEYKRVKALGGDVWFPLFTFNDENLAYYTDGDFSMPAFSMDALKKFRDKFRVYLTRAGYDARDIRYMACPEFGERNGRAHYHVMLFIPFHLTVKQMFGTREKNYTDGFLQRAWPYGYVSFKSKKQGGRGPIIESEKGIQYAFKYQWKRDKWYFAYGIDDYLRSLKLRVRLLREDAARCPADCKLRQFAKSVVALEDAETKLKAFRRVMPRRSQSMHFGEDGIKCFLDSDGVLDFDKCVKGVIDLTNYGCSVFTDRPAFKFNMPKYYAKKMFFTQNRENGLSDRTDFAKQVAIKRLAVKLDRETENLSPFFGSKEELRAFVGDVDLDVLKSLYNVSNVDELYDKLQYLIASRPARWYSVYDSVYRNVAVTSPWIDAVDGLDNEKMASFLEDNCFSLAFERMSMENVVPLPKDSSLKENVTSFCYHHADFASMPCYRDFGTLSSLIDAVKRCVGLAEHQAWIMEEERKTNIASANVVYMRDYIYL